MLEYEEKYDHPLLQISMFEEAGQIYSSRRSDIFLAKIYVCILCPLL
jgi:hypothetical protein